MKIKNIWNHYPEEIGARLWLRLVFHHSRLGPRTLKYKKRIDWNFVSRPLFIKSWPRNGPPAEPAFFPIKKNAFLAAKCWVITSSNGFRTCWTLPNLNLFEQFGVSGVSFDSLPFRIFVGRVIKITPPTATFRAEASRVETGYVACICKHWYSPEY